MKKKLLQLAVISGMLVTMSATVHAQWTRNAGTSQTYLTNTADNVGIGTTNPAFKLDIQNTANATMSFKSTGGNASILLDRGDTTKTASLTYRTGGTNNWQTGCVSNKHYTIRNNGLGQLTMFFDYVTNNIGIGTNVPANKLTVQTTTGNFGISHTDGTIDAATYVGGASGGALIGTKSNHPFSLYANNSVARLTVATNGNVGIGTTAPTSLLQVGNSSGAVTTPTAITMDNTYSSTGGFDKLKFYLYKSATESYGLGLGTAGDMQYWAGTTSTGTHRFFTSQQERMRISPSGNVGIGTTNAQMKLTVAYNTGAVNAIATSGTVDPSTGSRLTYGDVGLDMGILQFGGSYIQNRSVSNLATGYPLLLQPGGGNVSIGGTIPYDKLHVVGGLRIGGTNASNGFRFAQASGSNLEITYNTTVPVSNIMTLGWAGGVAIGTTTFATGYQLTVAGKIICTELKVQLQPFPDYVFAKDYNLKSISEVEDHIKTYNRLPGMPSACEIEEGGMSVGEMTGKVVEKVEENTLYIIQLNKENQTLKTQLNDQAKAIQAMQAQLDALKK